MTDYRYAGTLCPECGGDADVVCTRAHDDGDGAVVRQMKCRECGASFKAVGPPPRKRRVGIMRLRS